MKNPVIGAAMNYGGIVGFGLIASQLIIYILGLEYGGTTNSVLQWTIMIGGSAFFMIKFRNEVNGGFISFGQSFFLGFMILLFSGILISVYTYVFLAFIDPGTIDMMKEKAYEQYISMGMSDEEAANAMGMASKMMSAPLISGMAFLGNVFIGAVLSLLITLFVKKENPNPFPETEEN